MRQLMMKMQTVKPPAWSYCSARAFRVICYALLTLAIAVATLVVARPFILPDGASYAVSEMSWGALGLLFGVGHLMLQLTFPRRQR